MMSQSEHDDLMRRHKNREYVEATWKTSDERPATSPRRLDVTLREGVYEILDVPMWGRLVVNLSTMALRLTSLSASV